MSHEEMKEFDTFLNENDWDIYYWLAGVGFNLQVLGFYKGVYTIPAHIQKMSFIDRLVEHSKNNERKVLKMPNV
jgi:succinate dehydrogenase flavin-adding protein (antitoxin of CptAB toxin-antitoxin module)